MAKKYYLGERAVDILSDIIPYIDKQMRSDKFGKPVGIPLLGGRAFLAKLTSEGPNGEADVTNPRYWAREVISTNNDNDSTSELTFEYPERPTEITVAQWTQLTHWVVATNLLEIIGDTHGLSTNDDFYVIVHGKVDQDGITRFYFSADVVSSFLAKVGAAGTNSQYTVVEQEITSDATDTLVFGDLAGGRSVTATNLAEVAIGTNELAVDGSIKVRVFIHQDAGLLPRYVFWSFSDIQNPTDPEDIGATAEGAEAADADTWDRENPVADKDGVTFRMDSRVAYFDAGDEILYGYYRALTFDAFGRLTDVSAETRYEIDPPGACP